MRVGGELELRRALQQALIGHFADLQKQGGRIDHHAVADDADFLAMHDTAGDQVQNGFLVFHDQGVAGVGAALKAHHHVGELGVDVHHLALAFVPPLCPDNHDIRHYAPPETTAPQGGR